jgi:hypothetical protein
MYAMVNTFENIFASTNQFYMAGLMTAPMVILELILMRSMYGNRNLNAFILTASSILFILFLTGIRKQVAINDEQFLRSMIPHHAGAILMCEQASLRDPQIRELCKNIIFGQQKEIDFMKTKLNGIK